MALGRTLLAAAAWRGVRQRFGEAMVSDVGGVARRYRVDEDWKRQVDGYAVRLDPRTTIRVSQPVGRWRKVDPRRPQDAWRSPWKATGLAVWASAVAVAWWLGSSRGRGPLSVLNERRDGW